MDLRRNYTETVIISMGVDLNETSLLVSFISVWCSLFWW